MALPAWWVKTSELFDQRPAVPWSIDGIRTYVRRFLVQVNTKAIEGGVICTAPLIPTLAQPYENPLGTVIDPLAYIVKYSSDLKDPTDWQFWIVTLNYSTQTPRGGPTAQGGGGTTPQNNQPEMEFPEVSWDSEDAHVAFKEDIAAKLYVNSAGDPFIPAPTFPAAYPVLIVTRNELSWSASKSETYAYRLNSDNFMGYAAGKWMMYPPRARKVWKGRLAYYRVTYRMKLYIPYQKGQTTWQPRILDAGMRELKVIVVGLVGRIVPAPIIENAHQVTHPVCLDGNGAKATRDANNKIVPKWIDFKQYLDIPFTPLGLEQYL